MNNIIIYLYSYIKIVFIKNYSHKKGFLLIKDNIKVNFLVVGTQKGGTTALYSYLNDHPKILMSEQKEVHFFDTEMNFNKEIDYDKYHSYFQYTKNETRLLGEATPIYMYWKNSIKRIYDYNHDMKLIIILRNPIERAYSHWNMERDKGKDNLSFHDAIHTEKERCSSSLPLQHRVYSYIDRGLYSKQLKNIYQHFPKEQVLILKSEDLKNNVIETLKKVSTFLNIQDFENVENRIVHYRKYISKMDINDYIYLRNIFNNEINTIENDLDWDCSDWLKEPDFE